HALRGIDAITQGTAGQQGKAKRVGDRVAGGACNGCKAARNLVWRDRIDGHDIIKCDSGIAQSREKHGQCKRCPRYIMQCGERFRARCMLKKILQYIDCKQRNGDTGYRKQKMLVASEPAMMSC